MSGKHVPVSPEDCVMKAAHGNPFRYCQYCSWIEEPAPAPQSRPMSIELPLYVLDLLDALKNGTPLNFQGHEVPVELQKMLEKMDWDAVPPVHECIIDADVDQFAYRPQYLVGCRCHEGDVKHIWQPGDPPFKCPTSGVVVEDPRTLLPSDTP